MIVEPASVEFPALGTTASLLVTRSPRLASACKVLESELDEIDRACSCFRPDSDLMRVNRSGGRWVRVTPLLLTAIEVALRAARITDGDVDPTVGEALQLAGYDRDFGSVRGVVHRYRSRSGAFRDGGRSASTRAARWCVCHTV